LHYELSNSWAKFKLDSEKDFHNIPERLSFYFLWENPSDRQAVINVDTNLMLNGFCSATADYGYYPFNWNNTMLLISAELSLWDHWNQPDIHPYIVEHQVLFLDAEGGFLETDYDARYVIGNYNLHYNLFVVPPRAVAIFVVSLSINPSISSNLVIDQGDGNIHVDFESGDFEVMCPGVLIAIMP
jgi:hypothetical protein